jgi:penicillin-binding protein-related factor A (putative recombinase)
MTNLPFATVFTHQRFKDNYLQYLKQSYQQAPFSFLLDVREYRENPSLERAKTIALKYISDNFSALEINIDKFTKDAVLQAVNQDNVEPTVFDEAYK